MNEVLKFLQENPVQYVATVGVDRKAKCRPFMFSFEKDGKLWFCTNNQKDVYKDMLKNPFIEITTSSPKYEWIRISGEATFVDDIEIKTLSLENPIVKNIYKTPDNPIFEVFYLKNAKAIIDDFSPNKAREYNL